MSNSRQYDLVLFGATGYTGKLAASYIAKSTPTDLRWAIAGRSTQKLESVAADCKSLNPDRRPPSIEPCNLDDIELADLARKTKLFMTTVGPYSKYGELAFKACAENGTHYVDCTGEAPWVLKMIRKYEETAKRTGAIMVPQIGIESGPPDLMTWSMVSLIRQKLSAPTANVILSVHQMKSPPSGGTAASALSLIENVSFEELLTSQKPFGLSPVPNTTGRTSKTWLQSFIGLRTVPPLGLLTDSWQTPSDVPIVMRSWGLLGGSRFYGPKFFYEQYAASRTYFKAFIIHLILSAVPILLLIKPFRWLMKRYVPQPGDGPSMEAMKGHRAEWRAIAKADVPGRNPPRAYSRAYFEGGMYYLTGLIMTEAAMTILKDDTIASRSGGGILTPATLGQPLIDRLDKAGLKFETQMLG